jgi:hypothetical protein
MEGSSCGLLLYLLVRLVANFPLNTKNDEGEMLFHLGVGMSNEMQVTPEDLNTGRWRLKYYLARVK